MKKHTVYISLGSNLGNRKQYLQRAIVAISRYIGNVNSISPIYETPAWGFVSEPFYNACIEVVTDLSPEKCLEELQQIEKKLGRVRDISSTKYQARTIDLDIIYYDAIILDDKGLQIPHNQLSMRKFVLIPLNDIIPNFIHPILGKTTQELLLECKDNSLIIKLKETLFVPKELDFFHRFNYVAIEGNIGAGKTSLATFISEQFSGRLVLERYAENPFLAKFYENQERFGFALEMSFLTDRYQQVNEQLSQLDLFNNFIISDYDIFKSLIFASVTLNEDEFSLYRKIFYILYKEIPKPDLYVYLLQNSEQLLKNIQKRGRSYEKQIPKSYLDDIQHSYLNFLKNNTSMNILFIDVSELDFVENSEDYYYILSLINQY
ncbi:MAG: 2-amino-4-hydroxy-6-hydroxymethyldihydropteridine diphosphokinase [Capnocytophaga sp.]|nr:2-amino-4-hydroxy-6-hydroxymethyldihydropteridine diphosphokinase [Capnocytophaga sp.]